MQGERRLLRGRPLSGAVPAARALLTGHVERHDPGGTIGLYLFGSSVAGGLRPDSDVDMLLVTERSLDRSERADLTELLLRHSGSRASVSPGRPVELTVVVRGDVVPWVYPPVCDFLYGEWLRDEVLAGGPPARGVNPDLAVLLTTLLQHSAVLLGPDPATVLEPVPAADLRRSLLDGVEDLLAELVGDERNVLLTLARMLVTLTSGEIVAKDVAARLVQDLLPEQDRPVLVLAGRAYTGEAEDDWSLHHDESTRVAATLAARVRALAQQQEQ